MPNLIKKILDGLYYYSSFDTEFQRNPIDLGLN